MKGITKNCLSLWYERSINKNFRITYQAIHSSCGSEVSCIYDILAASKLSCKSPIFRKLFRKSPTFASALIISRYDIIFYFYVQYIFTQNI